MNPTARLSHETRKEGGKARRSGVLLSQPVLSENSVYFAPALLSRLSLSCRRRPYLQRPGWTATKTVVFAVRPVIGVATAIRSVPPRLLLADRRRHLAPFPALRVKMYGAELLRSVPDSPGAARRAVFAHRLTPALVFAALVRRSPFWKEKTEVESKFAHYQRPCLILTEVVALDSNDLPSAIVSQ
jgi:hypothetical protein